MFLADAREGFSMTKQSRRRQARCHRQDSERSNKKRGTVLDPRTRELIALASNIQKIAVRNQYESADIYEQRFKHLMKYVFSGQMQGMCGGNRKGMKGKGCLGGILDMATKNRH